MSDLDQYIYPYSELRKSLAARDRSVLEYLHKMIEGGVTPKSAREMTIRHFADQGLIAVPIVKKIVRPYMERFEKPRVAGGGGRSVSVGCGCSDRVARLESALSRLAAALGEDEIAQAIASERG